MYCKIGYLLGIKTGDENSPTIIEVKNQWVEISKEEYLCWFSIFTSKFSELSTPQSIDALLQKQLIIKTDWNEVSTQNIFSYRLVRQGLGMINDDRNNVYCVLVSGEGVIILSELQMHIWQISNGFNTIGEIYDEISKNKSICSTDFLNQVVFLVEKCLAFVC